MIIEVAFAAMQQRRAGSMNVKTLTALCTVHAFYYYPQLPDSVATQLGRS